MLAAALAAALGAPAAAGTKEPVAPRPTYQLADAAPSIDELIDRFLRALAAEDGEALHRLRATEKEYTEYFLPGNVEPGEPFRQWPAEVNRFYWGLLEDKSRAFEGWLMRTFGGRRFKVKSVSYEKGTKEWAGFKAYRQLRLRLEEESGATDSLGTGTIAEVGGQYKFISFISD